jgi:1-acyl-sn-glycerol-3-phosphate acyltransferase
MSFFHIVRAILETARVSAPTVWQGALGKLTPAVCDVRLASWSRRLLEQARVQLNVSGKENIPQEETFVVMSNHQSLYDIPVIFQVLERRVRMVTKQELFRVPGWGRAMRDSGFVPVDRGNRHSAMSSLKLAEKALDAGTNIWIAPEGTRSPSGELLPFKKGGFFLASAAHRRILPVSISGTRDVLAARAWTVHPGMSVSVAIHPPIDAAGYGPKRRQKLMDDVRAAIASGIPQEGARRAAAAASGDASAIVG